MAPKLKFNDGEKVLCFHGPLLYEAKCIKSQTKDKNVKYFIHYSGWNKNWDEWVPESRVLKYNDFNMQRQKELEAAHGKGKKTKGVGKVEKTGVKTAPKKESIEIESSASPLQEKNQQKKVKDEVPPCPPPPSENLLKKNRSTRAETCLETEEEFVQKVEIKIRMPDELKHYIVDDWNIINQEKKLMKLPAKITVDSILEEYLKHKTAVKGPVPLNKAVAVLETTKGITEYFNAMLGKQLLYPFERPQYNDVMSENPDSQPSQIYSGVHLLRMFTKIGQALAYTTLDEESLNIVTSNLYEFLKYFSKVTFLAQCVLDYVPATPEYIKRVGPSIRD